MSNKGDNIINSVKIRLELFWIKYWIASAKIANRINGKELLREK